jgi:hypothetical protein
MELPLFYKKGEAPSECTLSACDPVNFTIFNLNETGWKVGKKFGMLIYGKEIDPGTWLYFQFIMIMRAPHTRSFTLFIRRHKVSFPSQLKPKTCSSH